VSEKVFISYSHQEGEWVTDRLEPVLTASGVEVLIDTKRFRAGYAVIGEMDATQEAADRSVLVLSPAYLKSDYCCHEMKRAIARDPKLQAGRTLTVVRGDVAVPDELAKSLYIDLIDDGNPKPWGLLLDGCQGDLGTAAPAWLEARDQVRRFLERGDSVNFLITGNPAWRKLLDHLRDTVVPDLRDVDLDAGRTAHRRALVETILEVIGSPQAVADGDDLVVLDRSLSSRSRTWLAFLHFDQAAYLEKPRVKFFAALRDLIMTQKKLVALFHSRRPFADLLPRDHPLSHVDVKTVKLSGHP